MSLYHLSSSPARDISDYDDARAADLIEGIGRSLSAVSTDRLRGVFTLSARLRGLLSDFNDGDIGLDERLHVLEELPQEKILSLARQGLLRADDVFLRAALYDNSQSVETHWRDLALDQHPQRQNILDRALALASHSQDLDSRHYGMDADTDTVVFLLGKGANPNADGGALWRVVVEECDTEICRAFLHAGADALVLMDYINSYPESDGFYKDMLKEFRGRKSYGRVDDVTLAEITMLPSGGAWARQVSYYRFDTGRVTDIITQDDTVLPAVSYRFEDVAPQALGALRDILHKLGGAAPALQDVMTPGSIGLPLRLGK